MSKAVVLSGVILYRALCLLTQCKSFTVPVYTGHSHSTRHTHIHHISSIFPSNSHPDSSHDVEKKRDRL